MTLINNLKSLRNYLLRTVYYRKYQIGKGFYSGIRVRIWARKTVIIGKNFYIGRDSFIESDVIIGDNVIWANRVALVGKYDHHYQQIGVPISLASRIRDKNYSWLGLDNLTIIEDDVWVGYGSTIISGVKIGTGSIIATGSLVTKDVEPYCIYGGIPAIKLKNRFATKEDLAEHIRLISIKK
jgi:acetyltransferase-like isoleucine patch superfamily enzyme